MLQPLTPQDLGNEAFPYMSVREITVGNVPVRALRVTYVGELGWELYCPTEYGLGLWRALWEAGEPHGIVAAGYRAIDSMRLEKGYLVWGADITPDETPYEAGLGFAVKLDKEGGFIGREALVEAKEQGPRKRLVTILLEDPRSVALGNEPVRIGGEICGRVTTGGYGYTVERSIAYAYVPPEQCRARQRGRDRDLRQLDRRRDRRGAAVRRRRASGSGPSSGDAGLDQGLAELRIRSRPARRRRSRSERSGWTRSAARAIAPTVSGSGPVQVGGERQEHLRGRERVAVGVVGPVDRQAERARQVREPGRGTARGRSPGPAPPARRPAPRCPRSGCAAPARDRSSAALKEAALDRRDVGDSTRPVMRRQQLVEHLVERRSVLEVGGPQAVDADALAVGHPRRAHQPVAAVGEADPAVLDGNRSRTR